VPWRLHSLRRGGSMGCGLDWSQHSSGVSGVRFRAFLSIILWPSITPPFNLFIPRLFGWFTRSHAATIYLCYAKFTAAVISSLRYIGERAAPGDGDTGEAAGTACPPTAIAPALISCERWQRICPMRTSTAGFVPCERWQRIFWCTT